MKKLSELSLDELNKKKSTIKAALIAFGIIGVAAAITLFLLKAKPVLFIPLFVLPITWFPIFISLKSITDEIKNRQAIQNS